MRKVISLLGATLVLFVAGVARAQTAWVDVDGPDGAVKVKPTSVHNEADGTRSAWFKAFRNPKRPLGGEPVAMEISHVVANCAKRQYAVRSYALYDSAGTVIHSEDLSQTPSGHGEWKEVIPASIGDIQLDYLCK